MGINDRDYGRTERTPWDRIENPRSMVITLIVINVIVFAAQSLFVYSPQSDSPVGMDTPQGEIAVVSTGEKRSHIDDIFAVRGTSLTRPWLWFQTVTYGFLHNRSNILHLVFNMFLLYVFGRPLEQRIGGQEFLKAYLAAILVGGVVAMVSPWLLRMFVPGVSVDVATLGASGGVMAMMVMFACYYPHQELLLMLVLPVKAWVLVSFLVLMDLLGAAGMSGSDTAYGVHLAGALFGFLYVRKGWSFQWLDLTQLDEIPARLRQRSRRAKLKLHDPEKKIREEEREADRILAKIHSSGESSLTAGERRTLEKYSRRKRQSRDL
ncbi:rhomboid family intramembrane serine protease [Allorhodopirellula heiligendammensis]|uniref:Rhomboid family protein n=1 Tax=Allorhodopirellula heiligendammensis TaxID=2714739 RepID=A0A5C6C191_9BACT|nr:rhomboid family intramembrane serine protease [Allorhodopirellula heiligendammensis]TWU17938.1 Rhomboid family protein [Allorhodopirellula heiligendammensis]